MRKLFYNVTTVLGVQKADTYSQAIKIQKEHGGTIRSQLQDTEQEPLKFMGPKWLAPKTSL